MEGEAVFSHAADAGVDFVGVVAGLVVAFAGYGLGQADAAGGVAARVQLPEGLVGGPGGGVELVDQVDYLALDALEASDGGAELDAGAAVFYGDLVDSLAAADLVSADDRDGLGDGALPWAQPPTMLPPRTAVDSAAPSPACTLGA